MLALILDGAIRFVGDLAEFLRQGIISAVRRNDSRLAATLRSRIYSTRCFIDTGVIIKNKNHFDAGEGSAIYHGCFFDNVDGRFVLGRDSHLGAYCCVSTGSLGTSIGDYVGIGMGTNVGEGVTIGNNVLVGANCTILPGTQIPDNVMLGAGIVIGGVLEANSLYLGRPTRRLPLAFPVRSD
jgi:acetyltransferase-like isoleucine patch superfamily enzyme